MSELSGELTREDKQQTDLTLIDVSRQYFVECPKIYQYMIEILAPMSFTQNYKYRFTDSITKQISHDIFTVYTHHNINVHF